MARCIDDVIRHGMAKLEEYIDSILSFREMKIRQEDFVIFVEQVFLVVGFHFLLFLFYIYLICTIQEQNNTVIL